MACFTTAVGIVIGTADYFIGLVNESRLAYGITALVSCLLGIGIGQFNVHFIITIALPILMFIYPITIVLIFLNVLPDKYASKAVFRSSILVAFLFSIPDFLKFIVPIENIRGIQMLIPLSNYSLGWLLPVLTTALLVNFLRR